jgi:hypothetical protein
MFGIEVGNRTFELRAFACELLSKVLLLEKPFTCLVIAYLKYFFNVINIW